MYQANDSRCTTQPLNEKKSKQIIYSKKGSYVPVAITVVGMDMQLLRERLVKMYYQI